MMSIMAAVLLLIFNWKLIFFESFNFVVSHGDRGKIFRYFSVIHNCKSWWRTEKFCNILCWELFIISKQYGHAGTRDEFNLWCYNFFRFLSLYTILFFRKQKFSFSTAGVKAWSSENLLPFSRNYISLFATKYLI